MSFSPNGSLREPCGLSYAQLHKLSDEQVMTHLGAGHDDAIGVIFDRYCRLILRVALGILRDQGEAEDVTQEIFMELCRTAGSFEACKGTAKLWILRCAYRRSLNRKRHLTYRRFYVQEDVGEFLNELSSANHNVIAAMSVPESRRLARQMLAALDQTQRQVLEMAYFEGLSLAEISERTGRSTASVRHSYYRGLRKMRSFMNRPSEIREETVLGRKPIDAGA